MTNKQNELPTSHKIRLNKLKGTATPLTNVINKCLDKPEIKRMKRFSGLLDSFHLKNTCTTDVNGRKVIIDGNEVINFSSANYLGLDQHEKIINAAINGIKNLGNHSGCSRIFSSHENIIRLEDETSKLVGAESSLICANVSHLHSGAMPALFSGEDCEIFIDRYAHASMYQAALVCKAKGTTLTRVDVEDLDVVRKTLSKSNKETKVLLVDGLYSMQGNIPDLAGIQEICDELNTILYIDDAHGLGIYGRNGGGVAELLNLKFDNMILVGSYQKGLGAFGAFISGPASMIDYLRVSSKSYIFSGTLQPQSVEGALAAIELSRSDEGRALREMLYQKSHYIRKSLTDMGFNVLDKDGDSPIISVEMGSDLRTIMAGRKFYDRGVYLNSVMYPAVPKDGGILRISLNSCHSSDDIEVLLNIFSELKEDFDNSKSKFAENMKYLMEVAKSQLQGEEYRGL